MSVAVWDGKTLAADSQAVCAGTRSRLRKIVKSPDGFLAAGVGTVSSFIPWLRWVQAGMPPEEQPTSLKDATVIIVEPRGRAFLFEGSATRMPLTERKWAIGSGADYALGAMAVGADAAQAVRAACRYNVDCGGPVVAMAPGK